MKRILFLLLISLLSLTAMAQKLTVESFELTTSLDGKKYARLDANDDPCALIKVQLARQGAVFEGNVVGDVAYKTSEYWVYMYTGSTKALTVKVDGALPLRVYFSDYGIERLQSNYTYSLVLTLPNVGRQEVDLGIDYFVLLIEPADADASLRIDGQPKTRNSDGSFMVPLMPGTHRYSVEATGYTPVSKEFTMGNSKLTETVRLTADLCQLSVNCKTSEAQLYINNEPHGKGSWRGSLPSGDYIVEARQEGYTTARRLVSLSNQQPVTCQFEALEPILGGLNISYIPVNAEIWVDGQSIDTTPAKMRLTVGQHRVEIRKEGYQTFSQQISITEGEVQTLQGELEKVASPSATVTTSEAYSSSSSDIFNGHAYVDLGLKDEQGRTIYWATCNVGATQPEEAGLYFAWGETQGYGSNTNDGRSFDWANYKWCNGSKTTITKYCVDSGYGTVDNKTVLDPADDAAHVNWGGGWRMPTNAEQDQLREKCKWKWDKKKKGYIVKGPNGNTIFLPAAGYRYGSGFSNAGSYGLYWSSSLNSSYSSCAYYLGFGSSFQGAGSLRYSGRSVRAVCVSIE